MVQGRARRGGRKSLKCNFKDIQGFKCTPTSTILSRIMTTRRGRWSQFPDHHVLSTVASIPVHEKGLFLLESLLKEDIGVVDDDIFAEELKGSPLFLYLSQKCVCIVGKHKKVLIRTAYTSKKLSDPDCKKIMTFRGVYAQVRRDLLAVFPKGLLGSKANWTVFWYKLRCLMQQGYTGVLHIDTLMKGVKQSDIPWLQTLQFNGQRQRIVAKILRFMVGWALAYISSFWRVADTSKGLKFFDKRYWQRLEDRAYNDMIKSGKLALVNNTDDYHITAVLRFVPKGEDALRPLAVVKRQSDFLTLMKVHAFLNSIIREYPWKHEHRGNLQDVITVLQKLSTAKRTGEISTFYYVQTDIDDAFGSINHKKLQSILKKIFGTMLPNDYQVMEFKFRKYISRTGFVRDICKYNFKIRTNPPAGFTQLPYRKKINVRKLVEFLEGGPKVAVQFGKRKHVMSQGVGQGVKFSSFLSEVYCREIIETHLLGFVREKHEYLLRYADDILYITPHQNRARLFLEVTKKGFPDMNCRFSQKKTKTNVDNASGSAVRYLGGIIDFRTWTLTPSFETSERTVNCVKYNVKEKKYKLLKPREVLPTCSKLYLARNDPWFMDLSVNGTDVVLKTVESSARNAAEKLTKVASLLRVTSTPRPKLVTLTILQFCRRFVKSCQKIFKERFPNLEKQILEEDVSLAVLKGVFDITSPLKQLESVSTALLMKIREVRRKRIKVRKENKGNLQK